MLHLQIAQNVRTYVRDKFALHLMKRVDDFMWRWEKNRENAIKTFLWFPYEK